MTVRKKKVARKQAESSNQKATKEAKKEKLTSLISIMSILAVVAAVLWSRISHPSTLSRKADSTADPKAHAFFETACNAKGVYCHNALVTTRRTQKAKYLISPGETILEIPRYLLVSPLDAIQAIPGELMSARIGSNKAFLKSTAILAVHLARLLKYRPSTLDPVWQQYLDILPDYEELRKYHPVLWSRSVLQKELGNYTAAYQHVMTQRYLIQDEYTAFSQVSAEFNSEISQQEYATARVLVMSRSFTFLEDDSPAMVPIEDMYNHHSQYNAGFRYDASRSVQIVQATGNYGIPAGSEVLGSYSSKMSDSEMFAHYGFANADGSGSTEASLALYHQLDRDPTNADRQKKWKKQQASQMVFYLQYDDGYEQCVDDQQLDAWEFKKLKFVYLFRVANDPSRWLIHASPRNPDLRPPASIEVLETNVVPTIKDYEQFEGSSFFNVCRFLVMAHYDYNEGAFEMLKANMKNPGFHPPSSEQDGLQYRTLRCVERMTSAALAQFGVSVEEQMVETQRLNREAFHSHGWTMAHIRLGEMQTLQALQYVSRSRLREFGDIPQADPSYFFREKPCANEYVAPLSQYVQR